MSGAPGERDAPRRDGPAAPSAGAPPLEIERSFLLRAMPSLPTRADGPIEVLDMTQGYLPEDAGDTIGIEGRLRRIEHADGRVELRHTVKRGFGLVRTEVERDIDAAEFDRLWPLTEGRRVSKARHRVPVGGLVWEIDRFDEIDLVLAEVELPSAETVPPIPDWLAPFIVRDVTDEPEYRNSRIALRIWR